MRQSEIIHRQQIRRVYQMSVTGVYDSELLDDIVSRMCYILGKMKSTSSSIELRALLTNAKTDNEKMIAIDTVIHKAHTSGFYAQHLIQGTDKIDIMNFLSELAGTNDNRYEKLMAQLKAGNVSTVPGHALYGTIDLTGFEELNKTAIRDTRARFNAMNIKEYSFTGKTLLDIGCNVGHMLFEATTCGFPISCGLEQVPHIAAAGNAIADYLRVSEEIIIRQADASALTKNMLKNLTGREKFDIVFCFAVDGYVQDPQAFYKLLKNITNEILYFEPNNHKINWNENILLELGFKSVEKVIVPYDKNTGSTRDCFICYSKGNK